MKKLYSGFDLCAPTTSVSMTINGPAPIILALFMNTAIDQQVELHLKADPARWADAQKKIEEEKAKRRAAVIKAREEERLRAEEEERRRREREEEEARREAGLSTSHSCIIPCTHPALTERLEEERRVEEERAAALALEEQKKREAEEKLAASRKEREEQRNYIPFTARN